MAAISKTGMMLCALGCLSLLLISMPGTDAGCWDRWSRCSKWSSGGTGILWKSCGKRCEEMGKSGGNCVLKKIDDCWMASEAYQCVCNRN